MTLLAYTVALTAIGWTLWVRRGTWRNLWEAPTTAATLLMGVGLVLIAPFAEGPIGHPLFLLTTRWHVDDLTGLVCLQARWRRATLPG